MWVVAKFKKNEFKTFKENISKILDPNAEFVCPKIRYQKIIQGKVRNLEKFAMENYCIFYNKKITNYSNLINFKYIKGLEYFLVGFEQNQKQIGNFVNLLKSYENSDGYLKSNFFNFIGLKKGKFTNGAFTDILFDVIEKQKNKLIIKIGNIKTTIKLNSTKLGYQRI
tara:strand:+ start:743 stop:1246 length:504 start_codon:yes stop_codon:yes gene_type:complete